MNEISAAGDVDTLRAQLRIAEAERDEMRHRCKNVIATVQAITNVAMRSAPNFDDFRAAMSNRLRALAESHALMDGYHGRGADFRDMLEAELRHYDGGGGHVRLAGGPVLIPADLTTVVCMAFHELTTNAVKYGALSTEAGRIDVQWREQDGVLRVAWVERGGPPTRWPSRRGFGSTLFRDVVIGIARAKVEPQFTDLGFEAMISLPLH